MGLGSRHVPVLLSRLLFCSFAFFMDRKRQYPIMLFIVVCFLREFVEETIFVRMEEEEEDEQKEGSWRKQQRRIEEKLLPLILSVLSESFGQGFLSLLSLYLSLSVRLRDEIRIYPLI
jgi:hypothetical protein